jgi:type IV pilus assembly protein PilC
MKRFTYKAKDEQARVVVGEVEATSDFQAAKLVRDKGLVVISIRSTAGSINSLLEKLQDRTSTKQITSFTRQFATMINAGLPITEALLILRSQTAGYLQKVVSQILVDVDAGESLSGAMIKHPKVFSKTYIALVKSGESGGVLDKVLVRLADNLEKQQEFQGKVKTAMVYPIIIIIGMIVVFFIMMVFVIPGITNIYESLETDLPMTTKLLIAVSSFMKKFWILIIIAIGALIYGLILYRKTKRGRMQIDRFWLKIPLVGDLNRTVMLTEVTRTLSLMVGTGVSIIEGLNISSSVVGNVIVSNALKDAGKTVERGFPVTYAFSRHSDVFPFILSQMIAVGEETGKMSEVLGKLSRIFEMESDQKLKAVTSAIEPLIMVVLGVGVAFLVISVLLPIYTLSTKL